MSILGRIMLYYLKRILFNVQVSYFKKNWSLLMKAIITVVGKINLELLQVFLVKLQNWV